MKEKKLFSAMGGIRDEYINEAFEEKKKHPYIKKATVIAASIAVVLCGAVILPLSGVFDKVGNTSFGGGIVYPKAYAFDDHDTKMSIEKQNPVSPQSLKAVNNFGYKSAAEILKGGKNANYSPISLFYALGVTASGAGGETQKEMLSALGFSDSAALSKESGNLYRNLYFNNEIGKLQIANSLWQDKGIEFKKSFKNNAAQNFYASSHNVDLKSSGEQKAMGSWIRDNTNGTLTPKIETAKDSALVILNTVYFKDQWETEFQKENTCDDIFTKSDGGKVKMSFLCDNRPSKFYKGENFSRSSLELRNGGKMVFVLPDEGTMPESFLKSEDTLKSAFEGEDSICKVDWKIPKFGFKCDYELKDSLKSLGINKAFGLGADFSNMCDNSSLLVSKVHQGSYVSLNEEGVAASSFTEVEIKDQSAVLPDDTKEMHLTRPFLYGIYSENGTLLFIGVVENPNS